MPEDHVRHAPLIDQQTPPRPRAVRPRHAASLIVLSRRRRRRVDADGHARREASVHAEPPGVSRRRGGSRRSRAPRRARRCRSRPNVCCARTPTSDLRTGSASPRRANCMRKPASRSASRPAWMCCICWHVPSRRRQVRSGSTHGSSRSMRGMCRASSGVTASSRTCATIAMQEALALDLAMPTRRVLERLQLWLAMSDAGACRTHARPGHAARSRVADGVTAGLCRFRLVCKARYVAFEVHTWWSAPRRSRSLNRSGPLY